MRHTPAPAHRRARVRCAARTPIRALVAAVVAAVTVLVCGQATAAPASDPASCPRWTAVLVPGTGQASSATPDQPTGVLAPIGAGLRQRYGSDIDVRTLTHNASATPYNVSEAEGAQALSTLLQRLCSSTRVVLTGYSQGANIAGDVATEIGHNHGPLPASRIVAVALLSDPRRNSGTPQLGQPSPGEGIAGPRDEDFGALARRVRTICATVDIYCATSPQASPALAALGRAVTGNKLSPTSNDTTVASPGPDQLPTPTTAPATGSQASPDSTQASPVSFDGLDPSEIIGQVVTVLSGLAGFAGDVPAIVGDLAQLPALITSGNLPGLHQVSGDLNNQFAPLVHMASQIDLHLVARALTLAAPLDTSGWTAVAAQIVDILAGLDIGHLATDIGQAQEIAWGAVQKLTTGDPASAALALSGLLPVAADLATTAASALTGDAGAHLSGLAHTFTATTSPDTRDALTDLARRGGDGPSRVDQNGYTTTLIRQAVDWLSSRIDTTH